MFILTQLIGIVVVNYYSSSTLPYDLQIKPGEPQPTIFSLAISFAIAFGIIFLLMKYRWKIVMRLWFFFVVLIALGVAITSFFGTFFYSPQVIAILISLILSFFKVFKPNMIVHNITELLIYPGIAAIFVQFLNPTSIIGLLVLISLYDMWAVWQTGIMQKMAKFQMEELKVFGGFLLPSASKKVKEKISLLRQKYKDKKMPKNIQNKKFKISLAILGGGDVVFPIITSGVFLKYYGIIPALFVTVGALAGLTFLFSITKKDRAYPAMPYISAGIFLGLLLWRLIFF
jgi:presenilin-like A22 family membrane protease